MLIKVLIKFRAPDQPYEREVATYDIYRSLNWYRRRYADKGHCYGNR